MKGDEQFSPIAFTSGVLNAHYLLSLEHRKLSNNVLPPI